MKQKLLMLLLLFAIATKGASAQSRTLTGKVTGADDGQTLPGVSVKVQGTSIGTQTDAQGQFKINAPETAKSLTFSYLGYSSQTVTIGTKTTFNITLSTDSKTLGEVVVVGYGTKTVRELTGSIGHIAGTKVSEQPVENFEKALSGKIAGVQVSSSGGTLADGVSIRIRGTNSISSANYPLYVIDGVPMTAGDNLSTFNGGNGTRFDPLALINPSDIESIDVLKDAGATAIYGSRGANGVVIITTKKGKAGTSKISFDSRSSWATPSKRPNLLNGDDFNTINNEKVQNRWPFNGPVAVNSDVDGDGQPDRTDWMKLIYKTGFQSDNSISASGGTEKTSFFGSVRYADQNGILFGNRLRTAQVRLNVEASPNKYVHGGVNLSYSHAQNDGVLTDAYLAGLAISGYNAFPTVAAYNPNGTAGQGGYNLTSAATAQEGGVGFLGLGNNKLYVKTTATGAATQYLIGNKISNPLAAAVLNRNQLTPEEILGNAYLDIKPIRGLTLTTRFGVDLQKDFEDQYGNPAVSGLGSSYNGLVQDQYITKTQWNWQNYLSFDRTFGLHRVTFTGGGEYQYNDSRFTYASAENFADPFFTNIITNAYSGAPPGSALIDLSSDGNLTKWGIESYFARLGYTFNDRYSVEASFREDAYSGFGTNYRWGKFPSLSLGWIVSEESFLKNNKYINYLKIRGSVGKTGNQAGVGAYAARTLYAGGLYANLNGFSSSQLGNADLRWETQTKTDIGFNMSVLNSRINIDFDYFNNNVGGLILAAPVLYTVGVPNSSITTNIGSMYNRGFEATINTVNIKNKDFTWTSSFNYTHVTNKVTDLVAVTGNTDITSANTVASVGRPLGTYKMYNWAGVDPKNGYPMWYTANGTIKEFNQVTQGYQLLDGTATTNLTAADQYYQEGKTGTPTWYGGFDNTLTYKQFDLNFSFVYSGGNYIYNSTLSGLLTNQFQNNDARILNRWTTPGQVTDIPRLNSIDQTANQASTRFLESGNYARLRTLALGYRFNPDLIKQIGFSNIRLSAQLYNVFTITKYSGIDPEVNSNRNNTNIATGYDNRAVPQPRTFTLAVNASF
ncbi:SusC/RagA family TonB-linked outer membrane protein [Mucilaginibacter sp. AW1-3]